MFVHGAFVNILVHLYQRSHPSLAIGVMCMRGHACSLKGNLLAYITKSLKEPDILRAM